MAAAWPGLTWKTTANSTDFRAIAGFSGEGPTSPIVQFSRDRLALPLRYPFSLRNVFCPAMNDEMRIEILWLEILFFRPFQSSHAGGYLQRRGGSFEKLPCRVFQMASR